MKVRASIKKRSADCKIVRRKGVLFVINKKNQNLNKDKAKIKLWREFPVLIYQKTKEALSA